MINAIINKRKNRKKYSQVFVDRMEENKEAVSEHWRSYSRAVPSPAEELASLASSQAMEQLSIYSPKFDLAKGCKFSLDNFEPSPSHKNWEGAFGDRQIFCGICEKPAFNDCMSCVKCNTSFHTLCVILVSKRNEQPISSELFTDYTCLNCQESIDCDNEYYEDIECRLKAERRYQSAALLIQKQVMVFLAIRRMNRKRRALVLLQSMIRRKVARKKFDLIQRATLRVITLGVTHLPVKLMENDGIIVVTVYDTFRNIQISRTEKTFANCVDESFLLPGITAHMTVFFTAAIRLPDNVSYMMVGQAQLTLRDVEEFLVFKDMTVTFSSNVKVIPAEQGRGADLRRTLVAPCAVQLTAAGQSVFDVKSFANMFEGDNTCSFLYGPQNPIASNCRMIFAPPLDILKRSAEVGIKKKKKESGFSGGGNYRNSKYWLCCHRLHLYFYQYFGDSQPRLVADVRDAEVSIVLDKGRTSSLVNVVHADQRKWLLEFSNRADSTNFVFAFTESKKALLGDGGSNFISSSYFTRPEKPFGFDVPFYC